ncbi:MAG TPA: thioredoxin domain-containing protein [Pyrinomonadaceae bacterium]|jgi:protein-disulfide isomerase
MNHGKALIAASVGVFLLTIAVSAQTPKSKPKPKTPAKPTAPTAKPTPTPTVAAKPQPTPAPPAGTLALINGQPIMLADLDPKVRETVESFDKEVEEMRRTALEDQIGTYLLEAEAKKRKVTLQQLLDAEVNSRIKPPTEAEMKAFFDANRAQIGSADFNSVRPQVEEYLRQQSVQKAVGEVVTRLRLTTTVTTSADPNAANLTPTTVLATVGGRTITKGFLEERLKPYVYKRRMEIYADELAALNYKIYETLLTAEAKKRNVTADELFRTEVAAKVKQPTDADVAKFYEENKGRIQGDLASLREQISKFLLQQEQRRAVFELNQRLRSGASLQVLLTEPEPPVQAVSADDDPARGEKNAPVTVVVFTDFQCPSCAATHPMVDETIKAYGNRVRLVVRDFPLPQHAQARKAAEAAAASNAQGKFFEYIALLFKNQSALDVPSLKKYAAALGLDTARFNAALDSGEYAAEVEHDVEDGEQYGVDSTPSIFVNGVRLRDLTAEALRAAIDRALARSSTQAAPERATK